MKILVTGSEGSLMQYVIPVLLKNGHEVVGVDNFARYGEIERDRDYEYIKEMKTRIIRGRHPLKRNDLELCNELYEKYREAP